MKRMRKSTENRKRKNEADQLAGANLPGSYPIEMEETASEFIRGHPES